MWPSVKLAGGHLVASQEEIQNPGLLGVEWKTQSGIPSESKLESYMTGWSVSGGVGCVIGGDDVLTLSTINPARIGTEQGFYTPHLGVSINHTWQIYDAGSSTPWFFQKW